MRISNAFVFVLFLAVSAAAIGCAPGAGTAEDTDGVPAGDADELTVRLASPAVAGSAEPDVFAGDDGQVYMSWFEPVDGDDVEAASTRRGRFALRFARLDGDTWSTPRTIVEGENFFVNWADFPSIVATGDTLVAHWLEMNGGRGTSYDVHISRSTDHGATWEESVVPHADGTPTEHGFVSLVPEPDGGFTAVWLDGRNFSGFDAADAASTGAQTPAMTLRATRFDGQGNQLPEILLDDRICDCCQTSAAYVGDTLVAVYRDRSPEEIRDIWTVRRTPDGWQEPTRLAYDDWQIPGCPVNGPAIAAADDRAAVAWFSLREGNPEVKVAFTHDAGVSFSEPILLDRGGAPDVDGSNAREVAGLADASTATAPIPLGRVDIAWVDDARVAVSWIVARGGKADIVLQTVDMHGGFGRRHVVATTGSGRASGFPRIVRQRDRLVIAWTETGGDSSFVRTATIVLPLP